MTSTASTPNEYVQTLPDDRRAAVERLREVITQNLPEGFKEEMNYGMIGYVVPHGLYSKGYHCDPKMPLPFMNIASQKNFIAVYHMGMYANPAVLDWFTKRFAEVSKLKLDMGKSCIRFKKPDQIPFDLIGELASKMTVEHWIAVYEQAFKK